MKPIFLEIKQLEIAIPKTVPDRKCISTYLGCHVRQLLLLSYSATLVEILPKIYINFNWPAGLHLWSNYKSSTTTSTTTTTTTTTTSWTTHNYALVYWIMDPSIIGPLGEKRDDRVQQPI